MDIYVIIPIEELTLVELPPDGLELDHDCTITPDHAHVLEFVDLPLCENGRSVRELIGEIARNTIGGAGRMTFVRQESESDLLYVTRGPRIPHPERAARASARCRCSDSNSPEAPRNPPSRISPFGWAATALK